MHGLAISAAFRLLRGLADGPVPAFGVSVVAGVATGLAVYQFAEKPLMKLFRTGLGAKRPSAVIPAAAAPVSDPRP